jgi:hypothetical protein
MQNNNSFVLAAAAVLLVGTSATHAQTSNGTLTWYIYILGGDGGDLVRGDLVVQTSNVLTPSSVDLGPLYNEPPIVTGYAVESISGSLVLSNQYSETLGALLPGGTSGNAVEGCTGFLNLEQSIFPIYCTSANLTVDNLIVPHMNGRVPGLDNAGIGFAANWYNTNPLAVDQVGFINDYIQLYTQSGQTYMLDLGVFGGADAISITVSAPEPDSLALTGLGLSGIWWKRRHARKTSQLRPDSLRSRVADLFSLSLQQGVPGCCGLPQQLRSAG